MTCHVLSHPRFSQEPPIPGLSAFLPLAFLFCWLLSGSAIVAQTSDQKPWVSVGADGRLHYRTTAKGDHIPDFSGAGYRDGLVPLPGTPGGVVVPVAENILAGDGDQTSELQRAIERVQKRPMNANGFRGTILLRAGVHNVAGYFSITADGVVIAGEGEGRTILRSTMHDRLPLFKIGSSITCRPTVLGASSEITDPYVPLGSDMFTVDKLGDLHVGDRVIVQRRANDAWIKAIKMDRKPQMWKPEDMTINWERTIIAISGHRLTVDASLTNAIEKEYGGGAVFKFAYAGRVRNIGFRDFSAVSISKSPKDLEHAEGLLLTKSVVDAWVHDVTITGFAGNTIYIDRPSCSVTVQNVTIADTSLTRGGAPSGVVSFGGRILVRNATFHNAYHAVCFNSPGAAGPHAVVDCKQDGRIWYSGPHLNWANGGLYDNCRFAESSHGGGIEVALNARSRHGWTGTNFILWNCVLSDMLISNPPSDTGMCWAIGCQGKAKGNGYYESQGTPVQPHSLYLEQLRERAMRQK